VIGLELEQIPVEWMVEPRERGLDAIGRMTERSVTRPCRRRIGIPARPALQQATERERRGLARAELADEPSRRCPLCGVVFQHVGPTGLPGANRGHDY